MLTHHYPPFLRMFLENVLSKGNKPRKTTATAGGVKP